MTKYLTKQEIFDKVAEHLLTQGKKSTQGTANGERCADDCLYRSPDGLKCAAGALIPDEAYNEKIEGIGIVAIVQVLETGGACTNECARLLEEGLQAGGMNTEDMAAMRLLQKLQMVHDNAGRTDEKSITDQFRERLRFVAQDWKLDDSVLGSIPNA